MAIPTVGSFEMFNSGSETSLYSSLKASGAPVDNNTNTFNKLIEAATGSKFDPQYAGNITIPTASISSSLQFRGYPYIVSNCELVVSSSYSGYAPAPPTQVSHLLPYDISGITNVSVTSINQWGDIAKVLVGSDIMVTGSVGTEYRYTASFTPQSGYEFTSTDQVTMSFVDPFTIPTSSVDSPTDYFISSSREILSGTLYIYNNGKLGANGTGSFVYSGGPITGSLIPPSGSYNFNNGSSLSVSLPTPGTDNITGTLTVTGDTRTFKVQAYNQFNGGNNANASLTVTGIGNISIATTGLSPGGTSTSSLTVPPGSYSYTLEVSGTVNPPATSGAVTGLVVDVT